MDNSSLIRENICILRSNFFFVDKRLIILKAFKNYFVLINWKIIMSSEEMPGDYLEDISILKY